MIDQKDLVERLRREWQQEAPELDTSAMEVVGRIIHLASQWQDKANVALKPFGLSYTDFDILATLRRSGAPYELSPTALCNSVLLTSGAMTTALSRIEKLGLIERFEGVSDKRVKMARLTAKGSEKAYEASVVRFSLAEDNVLKLNQSQRRNMSNLLLSLSEKS